MPKGAQKLTSNPTAPAQRRAPTGWPGRSEAARTLGISMRTLRRYEEHGQLEFELDEQGHHRFDPGVLGRHAQATLSTRQGRGLRDTVQTMGQLAAAVFGRLSAGEAARDVVVALGLEPTTVVELHRQWLAMGHDIALTPDQQRILRSLLGARISSGSTLVSLVERQSRELAQARGFRYPCSECGEQLQATPDQEWAWLVEAGLLREWTCGHCAASSVASGG